jgi:hypothetical protein
VRGLERLGNLFRQGDGLHDRDCARRNPIGQRGPVHQLHRDGRGPIGLFESVHLGDVWMVQRREHLRLTVKPHETIGVARNR